MTSQQADLYPRLCAFQFNPNGSTLTFEDRLAKENGWSGSFTDRAVEEYRKFLLLAATAGHPVSPPDVVDQVWHLHLLYTRSYWDDLCRGVLPRPLHHEPSTGGAEECAKFHDWYANTVESYRRTFGAEPPGDIWPAPERPRRAERHQRVDLVNNWVLPKRRAAHVLLASLLALLLLGLASGCVTAANAHVPTATLNPLELRGPTFLVFYFVAFAVAVTLAAMLRAAVRGGGDASIAGDREDLDPFEIAYLRGGPREVAHVAVTRLVARGLLTINPKDGTLRAVTPAPAPAPATLHPIEAATYGAISPTLGRRVSQVYSAVQHSAERLARRLHDRELLVDESRAAAAATLATLVALSVPAVGLIKVFVGLSRGRPVGFLLIALLLTALAAVLIFARRPRRTRRGEAVLRRLTREHAGLRRPRATAINADLPLAVALFGVDSLAYTEYAPLRRTAHDGGAGYGSSCGSSGCGGGDGGGSGCGGGGCGGCGGGGCGG